MSSLHHKGTSHRQDSTCIHFAEDNMCDARTQIEGFGTEVKTCCICRGVSQYFFLMKACTLFSVYCRAWKDEEEDEKRKGRSRNVHSARAVTTVCDTQILNWSVAAITKIFGPIMERGLASKGRGQLKQALVILKRLLFSKSLRMHGTWAWNRYRDYLSGNTVSYCYVLYTDFVCRISYRCYTSPENDIFRTP